MKPDTGFGPSNAQAILEALHLRQPRTHPLRNLSDATWRAALDFCDRSRLTLALRDHAREHMPEWARERVDRNAEANLQRLARLLDLQGALARALPPHLEFLTLKGIAQTELSGHPAASRVQYDLDCYAPRPSAEAAHQILLGCGYESLEALENFPTDHLPPLIRKTGWEWRGDFFDPEIPFSIEWHFRFWNEETERLRAPGVDAFWERRAACRAAGLEFQALDAVDGLGYSALHVLRHLLRGNVNVFSVYELALILERHARRETFWQRWQDWHSTELRRLEAISFQLARAWFGCELPPAAEEAIERLPAAAAWWFKTFAASPLIGHFRPNKDELWLHLSLLECASDRWSVARRRLLPGRLPGPVDAVYLPESAMSWHRRWRRRLRYVAFLAGRVRHHALALPRTAAAGLRWWAASKMPRRGQPGTHATGAAATLDGSN